MRVATVDGLVILLYDGSKELYNDRLDFELLTTGIEHGRRLIQGQAIFEAMDLSDECKRYIRERMSWQQIIVMEGVTTIPEHTFKGCKNIKRVSSLQTP